MGSACSCCFSMNEYLWHNQQDLLQFDHTKPAPFISHTQLLVLRVTLSIVLFFTSVFVVIVTDWDSMKYVSQWCLYLTTFVFALMAFAQIQNQRSLKAFTLNVNQNVSDHSMMNITVAKDQNEIAQQNSPWNFWKWIIFLYQACFTLCLIVTIFFYGVLIQVSIDNSNVPYWDKDDELKEFAEILLNTVPLITMILEYPCNQIPFDWRMLPFDILLILIYAGVNFAITAIWEENNEPIYAPLDWFGNPGKAFLSLFLLVAFLCLSFACLWIVTQKYKLPRFRQKAISKRLTLTGNEAISQVSNKKTKLGEVFDHHGNMTETLDMANDTNYLLATKPDKKDEEPNKLAGDSLNNVEQTSERTSITSSQVSQRQKSKKYNPYNMMAGGPGSYGSDTRQKFGQGRMSQGESGGPDVGNMSYQM